MRLPLHLVGILHLATAYGALGFTVTVQPTERRQVFEGFGTALNTWHEHLQPFYREPGFTRFYREDLGASVLRVDLWCESVPRECDDWRDISYRDFVLDGPGARAGVTLEIARQLAAHPGAPLKLIATAWSPPPWMKINRHRANGRSDRRNAALDFDHPGELGPWRAPLPNDPEGRRFAQIAQNKLRPDRYLHFAKVLVEWTRLYRAHGLELYALSPQNEPRFSQWYESCVYTPAEYAELLRVVDWMFRHERVPKPLIFGPEHMTGQIGDTSRYLDAVFGQPGGTGFLDVIASHGYVDGVRTERRPGRARAFAHFGELYGKPIWLTEGGTGAHAWPAPLHQYAALTLEALVEGQAALLTPWQIVEPGETEHGLMTPAGPTKKTYIAMQFWRFLRPGWVRVEVESPHPTVRVGAFLDPTGGEGVLIALNLAGAPVELELRAGTTGIAVHELWVTDADRNCALVSPIPNPTHLHLGPEQVATARLRLRQP